MNSIDWIGFIGVFQILLAYILNISKIIKNTDLSFILLNFIGASMACYACIIWRIMRVKYIVLCVYYACTE